MFCRQIIIGPFAETVGSRDQSDPADRASGQCLPQCLLIQRSPEAEEQHIGRAGLCHAGSDELSPARNFVARMALFSSRQGTPRSTG